MHATQESLDLDGVAPASATGSVPADESPTEPASAPKLRVLIADDQLMAREVLRRLLKTEPDIELVGATASGLETVEAISRLRPDLVFLDVQMPELTGFGVLSRIPEPELPVIIFVTASEDFALKAFDVQAVDYLVKPCSGSRFQTALGRARAQLRQRQAAEFHRNFSALLGELRAEPRHPERIAIKSNGRICFLRLADLEWVEAADNYVELHAGRDTHLLRDTMSSLEAKLPAGRFLRIGRSTIVNTDHIKELQPLFHGDYTVVLRNGARLTLTRGYREKLNHFCWL